MRKENEWSNEELVIVAYYVLYERVGSNCPKIIKTLSDGLKRSEESIVEKIKHFDLVAKLGGDYNYGDTSRVYFDLKYASKKVTENELNSAIEKVLK